MKREKAAREQGITEDLLYGGGGIILEKLGALFSECLGSIKFPQPGKTPAYF